MLLSGGADSLLNVWEDVSRVGEAAAQAASDATVAAGQALTSALAVHDYSRALGITLSLDQPGRCAKVLTELLGGAGVPPTPAGAEGLAAAMLAEVAAMKGELGGVLPKTAGTGRADLAPLLTALPPASLGRLLRYVREWNTQSKHGLLAQYVLSALLKTFRPEALGRALAAGRRADAEATIIPGLGALAGVGTGPSPFAPGLTPVVGGVDVGGGAGSSAAPAGGGATAASAELRGWIAAVLPYSERHAERLARLSVASHAVDDALDGMAVLVPLVGVVADEAGEAVVRPGARVVRARGDSSSSGVSD